MADFPLIRDVLTIDQTIQDFYDSFDGAGPVFLLGRLVQHLSGFELRIKDHPLVIIADTYDGNGGSINASGRVKNPQLAVLGGNGADGVRATYRTIGRRTVPVSAGTNGGQGRDGGHGEHGQNVTLYSRTALNVHIDVSGTQGASGGNGGRGGDGGDGFEGTANDSGGVDGAYPGTHGGYGGVAGNGGYGGNGGQLTVYSTTALTLKLLLSGGSLGGYGGRPGAWGRDGVNCENPICNDDTQPCQGQLGANGTDGASPAPVVQVLAEADYVQQMTTLLNSDPDRDFNNFWAPFRAAVGEYYFRQFNPDPAVDDGKGVLAAREFAAALEMQGDNPEATRMQVFLQNGMNALGLAREMDVVPDFNRYMGAYNAVAPQVLSFFNQGVAEALAAQELNAIRTLVVAQAQTAANAVADGQADLGIAQLEQTNATDAVKYLQTQLDKVMSDIQASLATMTAGITINEVFGIVGQIGAALVAVVAAIPSAGTSLVALVPAVISLASTIADDGTAIVNAVFSGDDKTLGEVKEAYKKVNGDVQAVIAAGRTVVNFVQLVEKLTTGTTAANAQSVALVKQGTELTHQLLVAKSQVDLAVLRTEAVQARVGRAQALVMTIQGVGTGLTQAADAIRDAGISAIRAALAQADTVLTYAFYAQRSLEIYTLAEAPQAVPLDAGFVYPDYERMYEDNFPGAGATLVQQYQASWQKLLSPLTLQQAYVAYWQRGVETDILRLPFTDAALLNQLRAGAMPFRVELTALAGDGRETKIRGVAVALVGAASPSGLVSCVLEHGSRYEQTAPDGTLNVQILEARTTTVTAPGTPLVLDGVHFGQDAPLDAPQALSYWGRGVGGDWVLRMPSQQPGGELVNLDGLSMVQVWIDYQFTRQG